LGLAPLDHAARNGHTLRPRTSAAAAKEESGGRTENKNASQSLTHWMTSHFQTMERQETE